jgi:hypothetical protein
MILNEQKYANKTRLYYHGTDSEVIKKLRYPCIFLTTKIEYALNYTNTFKVFIGTIRAPLKIFNAKSKIDLKPVVEEFSLEDDDIDILQNRDWLSGKNFIRNDLMYFLEEIGFDGFFNFEFIDDIDEGPAIGLFNENNYIPKKLLQYEDLTKFSKVRGFIETQQNKIYDWIKRQVIREEKEEIEETEEEIKTTIFEVLKKQLKYINPDINIAQQKVWDYYLKLKSRSREVLKDHIIFIVKRDPDNRHLTEQELLFKITYELGKLKLL